MTRKIVIANPTFVQAVKADRDASRARHAKFFSQIKPTTVKRLQTMKGE